MLDLGPNLPLMMLKADKVGNAFGVWGEIRNLRGLKKQNLSVFNLYLSILSL